jgi:hypothetical protein
VKQDYLDMVRSVLDHEVVDSNEVPCGMVDDIEVEGGAGGELSVTALLVGVGAWADRLPRPFGSLAKLVRGRRVVRVPWAEVSVITERVKLRSRSSELGLGVADRKASRWIGRLPGA